MSPDTVSLVIALALYASAVGICFAKGKSGLGLLGLLVGLFALVGAVRLAKPSSWWWENRYGHAKRKAAWERYERTP